ncbi:MAG: hypothetical protein M3167_06250 [Acidobacteriota bacterium]|nr:hypothetical protein [Acidobacteriota bacterium]MDQ6892265.1 hypothetical protein [Acidobacteriota bacterium]
MTSNENAPEEDAADRRMSGISISLFRVVAFLVIYTTALVSGVGWILTSSFTNAVDSRLDRIALQNHEVFAKKAEAIPRSEFEIRVEMIRQEIKRVDDKTNEGRKAFDDYATNHRR